MADINPRADWELPYDPDDEIAREWAELNELALALVEEKEHQQEPTEVERLEERLEEIQAQKQRLLASHEYLARLRAKRDYPQGWRYNAWRVLRPIKSYKRMSEPWINPRAKPYHHPSSRYPRLVPGKPRGRRTDPSHLEYIRQRQESEIDGLFVKAALSSTQRKRLHELMAWTQESVYSNLYCRACRGSGKVWRDQILECSCVDYDAEPNNPRDHLRYVGNAKTRAFFKMVDS